MFVYSPSSIKVRDTLDINLQKVFNKVITVTSVDLVLVEGHREVERQFELFKKGRIYRNGKWAVNNTSEVVTYIDGKTTKGKHNYCPSQAVDICVYIKGRPDLAYDEKHLIYLGGIITAVAKDMFNKGEIEKEIIWGANWDNDGMIIYDHNFRDLPHFQTL